MSEQQQVYPLKEAFRITSMLDIVLGEDRFERGPVAINDLALEYSCGISAQSPIHEIKEADLGGCMGALVYSDQKPRQWGILCHKGQSEGRKAFTIAHEFGHYILHRKLIDESDDFEGGIYCDENSILLRNGAGIEKEADTFAATILMPLNDFRREIPANEMVGFERLGRAANRYGVSLTAAILRWLEYTETRAMMVVSNEGFAHWAWSSQAAFKSGRFIRTKGTVYELPSAATAVTRDFSTEAFSGIARPAHTWFQEQCVEMCIRSDRYDQEITLLHFDSDTSPWQEDENTEDVFDRFSKT